MAIAGTSKKEITRIPTDKHDCDITYFLFECVGAKW